MSIYKRGKTYWYKFTWRGEPVRQPTKQSNAVVARQMEAAHRTALAKGDAGLRDLTPVPTLREFAQGEFLTFVKVQFSMKPKTLEYYRNGIARLSDFVPLSKLKLDEITSQAITFYAQHRRLKLRVSSVNRELEVLRRMFHLATEWRKTERPLARVKMLRGEEHRERVLSLEEEGKYLAVAPTLLRDVVTILIECGLRPEEAFRLECSLVRQEDA